MANFVTGRDFGERLAIALGLGDKRLREIIMRVRVDEAVTVRFTEVLSKDVHVTSEGYVDSDQANNVLHEITHFRSGGINEFTRLDLKEDTGFLIADGPAERLARAVLAGDTRAALVLADYIQEEWIKHCEGRK